MQEDKQEVKKADSLVTMAENIAGVSRHPKQWLSGPSCSKLTISLINVSLKL